jgi:hypothetical protein
MKRIAFLSVACLAIASCGGGNKASDSAASSPATSTAPVSDVDKALAVQHGLDAAPGNADSVLAANGLTAAGLDSLMYRIASDSAKRAAFAAGH